MAQPSSHKYNIDSSVNHTNAELALEVDENGKAVKLNVNNVNNDDVGQGSDRYDREGIDEVKVNIVNQGSDQYDIKGNVHIHVNVNNVNNENVGPCSERCDTEGNVIDCLKICTWNINGWKTIGNELKKAILHSLNPDIICFTETHLI